MSTAPSVAAGLSFGRRHPLAALRLGEPVDRIDVDLGEGVGVLLRHLLDLDAALRREHPEVQLGARGRG